MSLQDRKPMLRCGKPYASVDEAERSKDVLVNGHEIVKGCPCGKVHTQAPKDGPRLSLRPQGQEDYIPPAVRKLVLERDGYCCVYCSGTIMGQRYSLGHRVRASQGGKAVPENLLTFHGWGGESCHSEVDYYKHPDDGIGGKGYRLPSWADPAMEPVWVVSAEGAEFKWLTPQGKYAAEPPAEVAA